MIFKKYRKAVAGFSIAVVVFASSCLVNNVGLKIIPEKAGIGLEKRPDVTVLEFGWPIVVRHKVVSSTEGLGDIVNEKSYKIVNEFRFEDWELKGSNLIESNLFYSGLIGIATFAFVCLWNKSVLENRQTSLRVVFFALTMFAIFLSFIVDQVPSKSWVLLVPLSFGLCCCLLLPFQVVALCLLSINGGYYEGGDERRGQAIDPPHENELDDPAGLAITRLGGGTAQITVKPAMDKLAEAIANGGADTDLSGSATASWNGTGGGSATVVIAPDEETMQVSLNDGLGRTVMSATVTEPED